MDPLTIGLITGGASLLGSIFSSNTSASNTQSNIEAQSQMQGQTQAFNAQQAALNRDFQANQVQINRDYQTQMSNSAYQRAKADMQAAGLNPMMMFGSGGPSSVPSGGAASGDSASVSSPNMALHNATSPIAGIGAAASQAVSSAVQAKTMDKMAEEMSKIIAEKKLADANTALTGAREETEKQQPARVKSETSLTTAKDLNVQQDTLAKRLDRARQEWEAIKYLDLSSIHDTIRKAGNIASWGGKTVSDTLAPITSSARTAAQVLRHRWPH